MNDEDVERYTNMNVTKVQLRGPEWDEHDPDHHDVGRPPSSPWENIEKLCRNISLLLSLQEVVIDPSYNSSDSQQLDSNYVVWLLSPRSKFSTLRIGNLDVMYQSDADKLAEAFS